jgi:hypothetical protein
MTASEGHEEVAPQAEAPGRDAIGSIQSGSEGFAAISFEEAEEGRVAAVVEAEAADESGVGDQAAPELADDGCAREGGGLRGEAEEDLGEQILVFQRRCRRRRSGAAAEDPHPTLLAAHTGRFDME